MLQSAMLSQEDALILQQHRLGVFIQKPSSDELGEELFKIHSHAEIVANSDPDEIVYRESDVIRLLQLYGFPKPNFNWFDVREKAKPQIPKTQI